MKKQDKVTKTYQLKLNGYKKIVKKLKKLRKLYSEIKDLKD